MHKVIIIGSGISGLLCLKHLIDVGITNVIVLDKNPEPFGIWNINNHPSVLPFTYCVSSKLYMTLTDFPLPKNTPEFPHHSIILKYYQQYAKHFNLLPYINNNITVLQTQKINNLWQIKTNRGVLVCEYLIVATGAVNDCLNVPDDYFFKKFTGKKYHCDQFKKIQNKLVNKKILIVGGSDTACDIAVNLCEKNKVAVSMKNGRWFQPRFLGAKEPADAFYSRMSNGIIKKIIGKKPVDNLLGNGGIKSFFGKNGSGVEQWEAKCDYLNDYYVKSRDIIDAIAKGKIQPKSYIGNIQGRNIKFIGEDKVESYDVILFCTGYKTQQCQQFLPKQYNQKYKFIFPLDEKQLYFVGFVRPYLTSIPMMAELQSRWVAKIISKKCILPNNIHKLHQKDLQKIKKEFPCSYKRVPIVDPYDYCDFIGKQINAIPNTAKLFFTNHKLWKNIMLDSWNHHFYRLNDTNAIKKQIAINNINNNSGHGTSILIRETINDYFRKIIIFMVVLVVLIIGIIFFVKFKKS